MSLERKKYWPFEVLPIEQQTEQHKRELHFLQHAHASGCAAYMFGAGNFGAAAENGRVGEIIRRGRDRYWEVFLSGRDECVPSLIVDGFDHAAETVLKWLRGDSAAECISVLRDWAVKLPGERGW